VRGRGCNTIQSPQVTKTHHVDPTVMCGKQSGSTPGDPVCVRAGGLSEPQGKPNAYRKSADGIVGESQARLVRHSKAEKAEQRIGQAVKIATEGLNGERYRMVR